MTADTKGSWYDSRKQAVYTLKNPDTLMTVQESNKTEIHAS